MNLLILGGSRFVGYHLMQTAASRGHGVTLFHRGTHAVEIPAGVESIRGDRHHDLSRLRGRRWDAVIDTSGYVPHAVAASARALTGAVDRYVFISTVSVYRHTQASAVDESSPVETVTDEEMQYAASLDTSGSVSAATYGPLYGGLKAASEAAVETILPNRALILRPGLIVGPRDYTDRLTYWPMRVARGGEVLAPGDPRRHVQFIDVRDLAAWTMDMIERAQCGVYNANGEPGSLTMAALLDTCRDATGSDATVTWVDETFLLAQGVTPWTEVPLWVPADPERPARSFRIDRALAAGLRHRPLRETLVDTWRWYAEDERHRPLRAGLTAERERELLERWSQRL